MKVKTNTENLSTLRRVCLELLASDHYGDCTAPCKLACPAGIDIQGQIALIADGQYEEAAKLIKESNPLPSACGRVCPRFCETSCRRNLVDEPVAINALKRFVADYDMAHGPYAPTAKPKTGRRVAIVGGGPAGLSAAYYLALEGHAVEIFEASPKLGGMLRYGIPEYRLPKETLDKEIETITKLCEAVHLNCALGSDFTVESLKRDGFAAIFMGLGCQVSQKMRVAGEETPGVLTGVDFLRDVALGNKVKLGERVIVIGGGNTAMDAARTSLRLGAKEVVVLYRRTRAEMPAAAEEVEEAEHEGAKFHFLSAPVRIVAQEERAVGIECIKMELGEADATGRRRPVAVEGSEFVIEADTLIAAIGQMLHMPDAPQAPALNKRGRIETDEATTATSIEGVFSGGDAASGPATVVEAVGAGKRAARSIHQYLNGEAPAPGPAPFNITKGALSQIDPSEYASVKRAPRAKLPALSVKERALNFKEVESGLSEEAARSEASRCLSCGCSDVFDCELRALSGEYGVEATKFDGEKHRLPIPDDHRYIVRDNNKCILCGRCARICSELMGLGSISFVNRGFETLVQPSLGQPLEETQCESCGQCVSTCPTGALSVKVNMAKPGPFKTDDIPSACPQCGIDCALTLKVKGSRVVDVTSPLGNEVNDGNLCKKGRFGLSFIHSKNRITEPLIRRDGHLEQAGWDEALTAAAEGLKGVKSQFGGDKMAVLASPKLTNEENYLTQKLARMALRTNNIGNSLGVPVNDALAQCFGKNSSTCSFVDIGQSDLIVVFGSDICTDYPIVSLKIKDAVGKGSRLAMVNSEPTRIDALSTMTLKVSKRMNEELLQTVLNYVFNYGLVDKDFVERRTLGLQVLEQNVKPYSMDNWAETFWIKPAKVIEFIHLYVRAKNPLIIVDADKLEAEEMALLSNLALVTGNVARAGAGIVALRGSGNSQGQIEMGISSKYLPGQEPAFGTTPRQRLQKLWGASLPKGEGFDAEDALTAVRSGQVRGILAIGGADDDISAGLLGDGRAFSVAIAPVMTDAIAQADVVLPGSTFAESDGTFISSEQRLQRLHKAIEPVAGRHTWQVLCDLSSSLGYKMKYESASGIFDEIRKAVPAYGSISFDDIGVGGVTVPSCDEQTTFIAPQWLEKMAEAGVRKQK